MTPLLPSPAATPGTTAHPIPDSEVQDYLEPRDGLPSLTNSPELLAELVRGLAAGSGPIAVDAERASGFRYGQDAYLIQLRRAGYGTALIDPRACGPLESLAKVMAPQTWVFHAADQDLPCLKDLGLVPTRIVDTEIAARLLGRTRFGLGSLIQETLGLRLAKQYSAVDWSQRPLPDSWLIYAALDVEWLLELAEILDAELQATGREEWARQEYAAVLTRPPKPAKIDPWRRTPRSGRTVRGRRALGILRELWTAREELARDEDLSPSKLLPHSALIAAATRRPTSKRQLQGLHDFSTRQARQHLDVWWTAIKRAQAMALEDLPPLHASKDPHELPPPKFWERTHPEAAQALRHVRTAVQKAADELGISQDTLLTPEFQRRLAWEYGEAREADRPGRASDARVTEADVEQKLADYGARPWQREQVSARLAAALS